MNIFRLKIKDKFKARSKKYQLIDLLNEILKWINFIVILKKILIIMMDLI